METEMNHVLISVVYAIFTIYFSTNPCLSQVTCVGYKCLTFSGLNDGNVDLNGHWQSDPTECHNTVYKYTSTDHLGIHLCNNNAIQPAMWIFTDTFCANTVGDMVARCWRNRHNIAYCGTTDWTIQDGVGGEYGTPNAVTVVGSNYDCPEPTANPTPRPTAKHTANPTAKPSLNPTPRPTEQPTPKPSETPSKPPSAHPSLDSTMSTTAPPTPSPTEVPSAAPTKESAGEVQEGDDDDDDDDDGDDEQQRTGPTEADSNKDIWSMIPSYLIVILFIFLGLCCCLAVCVFWVLYKVKVMKEMEQEQQSDDMPTNVATDVNSGSNAMGEVEEEDLPQSDVFGGEKPGGYGDNVNMLQMQQNMAQTWQQIQPVGYMANPMMNVPQPVVQQAPYPMLQPLPQAPVMPPATAGNTVRNDSDDDSDNEPPVTQTPQFAVNEPAKAPSSGLSFGKCSGCGNLEAGKEDEDDGEFYCNGCWESYCD